MKKTQIKDIVRNIRTNAVSWLAIVIVVTITCGVYCGVFFYADALEKSAEDFFSETNFEDLTVTSANGVTDEEIQKLLNVSGVSDAEGTYRLSNLTFKTGAQSHNAGMQAITERISVPELLEGRLPDTDTECAMTADSMKRFKVSVGDEISLKLSDEISLSLTVTGIVRHPEAYYQGESVYVFVPASTFENLFGTDSYPVVLLDTSSEGSLFSDKNYETLSSVLKDKDFVITSRTDHESFIVLRQIVDILRKLSTIFVVIFVVIGAIVVFSTITIIIDGQKQLIGFMKAYGFRNSEIVRRYLIYGESATFVGMLLTIGLAYLLQLVIQNVLDGMFCTLVEPFAFRIGPYSILLLVEIVLTGIITALITIHNASKYSAVELLNWNNSEDHSHKRKSQESTGRLKGGALYPRLILRNMRTDWARVGASLVIIAGCCFMIGIGLTLNSSFHSMTKSTRSEISDYDIECTLNDESDIDKLEEAVLESGATCARIYKKQTVYRFENKEEYVNVIAAGSDIYQDYIHLIGSDGKEIPVPDKNSVLVQNRISERLGVKAGDDITLFDENLKPYKLQVSGTARNYIGRVMYLSEDTFKSVFGTESAPDTLLVRLNGLDSDTFSNMLSDRFPDVDISFTDTMPGLYLGLTDAFNALIYVLITLSVIMSVFVLLNLVNIFVSRRKNELVIMDINGFNHKERIGYLLRETIVTTALGLILGVLFGACMTEPVVKIIESPDTMCVRSFNWKAWAVAIAMESLFALIINMYAFRKVKRLNIGDLK